MRYLLLQWWEAASRPIPHQSLMRLSRRSRGHMLLRRPGQWRRGLRSLIRYQLLEGLLSILG
jgi:hypothetical protein